MADGPALRGAVLGAGAEARDGAGKVDAEPGEQRVAGGRIADELRQWFDRGAVAEQQEAIDESRDSDRVEAAHVVHETVAVLAEKSGAPRDAREPRHERGLDRVRQQDGLSVAAAGEIAGEAPASAEVQHAVTERTRDEIRDLRHAPHDGQNPRGREDIDGGLRGGGAEPREERLGHHHVAHPARADDEDAVGHGAGITVWVTALRRGADGRSHEWRIGERCGGKW